MKTSSLKPNFILSKAPGFSMVELMIGMILGLLVIGGVISVFVATQQANRTTEGLSRAQETERIGFELLARSIREAGGNYCGKNLPFTTNTDPFPGYFNLNGAPLLGVDQDAPVPPASFAFFRIPGTDSIRIFSGTLGEPYSIVASGPFVPPAAPPAAFTLNRTPVGNDFDVGSYAVVCDYTQVSQFRVTAKAGNTISYAPPANPGLFPFILPRNSAHSFMLDPALIPATLAPFHFEFWYVGVKIGFPPDPTVRRALYRASLTGAGNVVFDEMLENVTDMQITYSRLGPPANQIFVPANPAWTDTDWGNVIAVRITLTIETPVGTNERADNTLNADANGDGVLENVDTADINEHLTARRTLTQTIIVRSRAK